MATKQKTSGKAAAKTAPKAKAEKKFEGFDGQKGYGGTGSDYRPPDTDPAKQTMRTGTEEELAKQDAEAAERQASEGGPAKDED